MRLVERKDIMLNTDLIAPAVLLIAVILLITTIASIYCPRYRIVKYEKHRKSWYTPQMTYLLWIFWEDMKYQVSAYSEFTYRFSSYEKASNELEKIKEMRKKPTMMVMK